MLCNCLTNQTKSIWAKIKAVEHFEPTDFTEQNLERYRISPVAMGGGVRYLLFNFNNFFFD